MSRGRELGGTRTSDARRFQNGAHWTSSRAWAGATKKPQRTQISRHRTRELLRQAMENQGLLVYPFEWWHFDYADWPKYPILNTTFDDLLRKVPE